MATSWMQLRLGWTEAKTMSMKELARGVQPGIVWCFARESLSMGGGLHLGLGVKNKIRFEGARICRSIEVPGACGEDKAGCSLERR